MKRTSVLALAFVFGSVPLAAQSLGVAGMEQPAASGRSTLTVQVLPPAIGCPVQMHARHLSGMHRVYVRDHAVPETPGLRFNFVVTSPRRDHIIGATVTLRGLNGKSHVVETRSAAASPETQETMRVDLDPGDGNTSAAELIAPGFVVVSSIELNTVTFTDGSTWKLADNQACQIAPDPLMLIAAH